MPIEITVEGLDELIARMNAFPNELIKVNAVAMSASLNTFWEKVPPYPQQSPGSTYVRTGTLGKSLGSSMSGGASGGKPNIYTIRSLGAGNVEGKFGSRLSYAPAVIGESQAPAFDGRWWNIKTIAERATSKIDSIWKAVADKLAAFLDK